LVVLSIFKNISQWERLSHILWKINNVWNHQPVNVDGVILDIGLLTAGFVPKPHGSVIPKYLRTYMLKQHKCPRLSVRSSQNINWWPFISSFSARISSDPSAPALGYVLLLWTHHVEIPEKLPGAERHPVGLYANQPQSPSNSRKDVQILM
jgi:hypothetical protein